MVKLDQFYTKTNVAIKCFNESTKMLKSIAVNREFSYIECSAGDGAFYDLLPINNRIGIDVAPARNEIIKADFLKYKHPFKNKKNIVVIGNPPFGSRGKLAISFVNKAFTLADTVAFIVPVIFRKYFIHKQIEPSANWIHSIALDRNSFRTVNNDNYSVNTEFQIWTKLPNNLINKRLLTPPPIAHKDFTIWQYNNTKQALKMFDKPFEFCVLCQGYQDYQRKETKAEKCEKNKQWMLFKTNNQATKDRLYNLDFNTLAYKNTTVIPGFRKADLVKEYQANYG